MKKWAGHLSQLVESNKQHIYLHLWRSNVVQLLAVVFSLYVLCWYAYILTLNGFPWIKLNKNKEHTTCAASTGSWADGGCGAPPQQYTSKESLPADTNNKPLLTYSVQFWDSAEFCYSVIPCLHCPVLFHHFILSSVCGWRWDLKVLLDNIGGTALCK